MILFLVQLWNQGKIMTVRQFQTEPENTNSEFLHVLLKFLQITGATALSLRGVPLARTSLQNFHRRHSPVDTNDTQPATPQSHSQTIANWTGNETSYMTHLSLQCYFICHSVKCYLIDMFYKVLATSSYFVLALFQSLYGLTTNQKYCKTIYN